MGCVLCGVRPVGKDLMVWTGNKACGFLLAQLTCVAAETPYGEGGASCAKLHTRELGGLEWGNVKELEMTSDY